MNIPDYYTDIAHVGTAVVKEDKVQNLENLSPFFARVERYIAALYIATDHIEDSVSLKNVVRTLAGGLFLAFHESTQIKKERVCIQTLSQIQSIVRILVVGGYISEQNATVLLQAANILKKEGLQFFKQETIPRKSPAEIYAFLNTATPETLKKLDQENPSTKEKEKEIKTEVVSIEKEKEVSLKDISKSSLHTPSFIVPSAPSKTTATPIRIQKSEYVLQQHVPTGFSQSILDLKKESKDISKEVVKNPKQKKSEKDAVKSEVPKSLKKEGSRRERISSVLSEKKDTTIKDIVSSFPDISEKTLQRELNDMVESGLLRRLGERRWSRYELVRFGV
jgi:hypothetical protein